MSGLRSELEAKNREDNRRSVLDAMSLGLGLAAEKAADLVQETTGSRAYGQATGHMSFGVASRAAGFANAALDARNSGAGYPLLDALQSTLADEAESYLVGYGASALGGALGAPFIAPTVAGAETIAGISSIVRPYTDRAAASLDSFAGETRRQREEEVRNPRDLSWGERSMYNSSLEREVDTRISAAVLRAPGWISDARDAASNAVCRSLATLVAAPATVPAELGAGVPKRTRGFALEENQEARSVRAKPDSFSISGHAIPGGLSGNIRSTSSSGFSLEGDAAMGATALGGGLKLGVPLAAAAPAVAVAAGALGVTAIGMNIYNNHRYPYALPRDLSESELGERLESVGSNSSNAQLTALLHAQHREQTELRNAENRVERNASIWRAGFGHTRRAERLREEAQEKLRAANEALDRNLGR